MGKGPRDDGGDGYGYDPERSAAREVIEKLERRIEEQPDRPAKQLGEAAKVRKITAKEKRLLDARAKIMHAQLKEIAYQHTVFCQTSLPYRPTKERKWECEQGNVSLLIEAGRIRNPMTGKWEDLPLPHGEKPRLFLMHLHGEALRTGSPEIEVERSFTAFARSIGIDTNGQNLKVLKEQMARLSAALIRMSVHEDRHAVQVDMKIVTAMDLWFAKDESQRVLWPSAIRLSTEYFESLTRHAVPLDRHAVAALKHSAMALDVYSWLAQRLHRIGDKPQMITWLALKVQFGPGYARLRAFRAEFIEVLKTVRTVYPAARFEVTEVGLRLRNSPPPVAKPLIRVGGKEPLTITGTVIKPPDDPGRG